MDKSVDSLLSVFRAVVERGSISAAADVLSMSKSSVSRQVRDLEAVLKQPLLEREPARTATVTSAGYHAYRYASLLDQLDNFVAPDLATNGKAKTRGDILSFGAHEFVAERRLPPILDEFVARRPETKVNLRKGRTSDIVQLVRREEIDFGFVLLAKNEKIDGLISESIGVERLAIFAVPGHPLSGRTDVSCAEANRYAFAMPAGGGAADDGRILSILSSMGLKNARTAAAASDGTTWYGLSANSPNLVLAIHGRVEPELDRGQLVEIDVDTAPVFFDVHIVWRDEWEMSAVSRKFLAFARSWEPRTSHSR